MTPYFTERYGPEIAQQCEDAAKSGGTGGWFFAILDEYSRVRTALRTLFLELRCPLAPLSSAAPRVLVACLKASFNDPFCPLSPPLDPGMGLRAD